MLADGRAALDQDPHQRRADALAAASVGDVDRVLDGEPVAGPGAEVAEGGEAGNGGRVGPGDEQGRAVLLPRLVPGLALVECRRLLAVDRRRRPDDVVVDGEDGGEVVVVRVFDP